MKDTTGHSLSLLAGGLSVLVLAAFAVFPGSTTVDERAFVSADKVRAAIKTATTEKEGLIGGITVETEDDGPTLVEVIVKPSNEEPYTVEVNAETGAVEEIEEDIEEHHELGEEEGEYEEEGEKGKEYEEGEEHDDEEEHGGEY